MCPFRHEKAASPAFLGRLEYLKGVWDWRLEGVSGKGDTEKVLVGNLASSVELQIDSRKTRVLDPEIPVDKRAEIDHTMQATAVLDVDHLPEISYQSTTVSSSGDVHWKVHGILNLRGQKQPIDVEVISHEGHCRGSASFEQSTVGINPIRIAGGTVKVKDELKLEFDIVPVQ